MSIASLRCLERSEGKVSASLDYIEASLCKIIVNYCIMPKVQLQLPKNQKIVNRMDGPKRQKSENVGIAVN